MEACMGAYAYRGTESEDGKSRKTLETHPVPNVKIVLQLRGVNGKNKIRCILMTGMKNCAFSLLLYPLKKKSSQYSHINKMYIESKKRL